MHSILTDVRCRMSAVAAATLIKLGDERLWLGGGDGAKSRDDTQFRNKKLLAAILARGPMNEFGLWSTDDDDDDDGSNGSAGTVFYPVRTSHIRADGKR
jgi:hypothetical protein